MEGPAHEVWIVEDDARYRSDIVTVLNHSERVHCPNAFGSVEALMRLVDGDEGYDIPDVVLMDIELPGESGISGVTLLKERLPEIHIVMLTMYDEADLIFEALRAGASGYLLKDTSIDDILQAVHVAARGGTLLPPPVARKVLGHFQSGLSAGASSEGDLTAREREILQLMSEGLAYKEIAARLSLSRHTVDNHIRSIYRKLHVSSGIEAVAKAFRQGLLDP